LVSDNSNNKKIKYTSSNKVIKEECSLSKFTLVQDPNHLEQYQINFAHLVSCELFGETNADQKINQNHL
jgi:hypothetical protein